QVGLRALRVARSSDRDDDIFLGDQVLDTDVAVVRNDPGATLIAVLLDDLGQFVRDDLTLAAGPGEDVVVVVDLCCDAGVLIDDPLPLERGQPAQLHVEDGRRLDLIDVEQLHQAAASRLGRRRSPDERDPGVQLVQRLEQAAHDVDAFLGLAEQVSGAPKVVCSWVCLNRLFSTTLATASRLRVTTIRMPMRSDDSSLMSAIPATRPSRASCAMDSMRLSGLT